VALAKVSGKGSWLGSRLPDGRRGYGAQEVPEGLGENVRC
jgi:hypothetical protein